MNATPTRWLAVYRDDDGNSRAAMIQTSDPTLMPFGINDVLLGLPDYNDCGGLTFVEMPADPDFRPLIVDCFHDAEEPLHFINL